MALFVHWVEVRCQGIYRGKTCGKVHAHAVPGSRIRFRCHRCKTMQVVEI